MVIGLTGGIGSGKSTIAKELVKRGFAVYDCDREAKRIIAEDKTVQQAIIGLLGEEAFVNGQYNTSYVAKRVFENDDLLAQLNGIVHPAVLKDLKDFKDLKDSKDLIVESAILFEAGLDALCDKIVVVEAPEEIRLARTIERDYRGQATPAIIDKVRARMRAQKTSAKYSSQRPVLIVQNDGTSVLSRIIDLICDFGRS